MHCLIFRDYTNQFHAYISSNNYSGDHFLVEGRLIRMALINLKKKEDSAISEANFDKIEESLRSTEELHAKSPVGIPF
ncbi:hypothetical protein EON65_58510 [archaeon]|nr:MAG: hypothetical protein EON65_58510 [archaeon]